MSPVARRRRWLRALGPAVLLSVGGAYALASWNWCGDWPPAEPAVTRRGASSGPLSAGAGRAELAPPFPVHIAGYGPLRGEARRALHPLFARAIILQAGESRVALVSLDLMSLSDELVAGVRAAAQALGLSEAWVVASHSHSSMGAYDPRLVAELVGTGRYRPEAIAALLSGASAALRSAVASMEPVTLQVGEGAAPELVVSRDEGLQPDPRLTRIVLRGRERAVAELVIFSAHPTLEPRELDALSPDYPGAFCQAREAEGGAGLCLLLQGAGGNTSAELGPEPVPPSERAQRYGTNLAKRVDSVAVKDAPAEGVRFARVKVALPRPDASRFTPLLLRSAGDNFLCGSAARQAELSMLEVGPLRLLAVPGEPTYPAAQELEAAAKATRIVSVANGYVGYIDTAPHVRAGIGESRRQYFDPTLEETLRKAASAAAPSP